MNITCSNLINLPYVYVVVFLLAVVSWFFFQMWIYSLGITLRRAVHTFSTGTNQQASAAVTNPSNNKNPTSLECVIRAMCAPNIYYRASLMYLLNVSNMLCINMCLCVCATGREEIKRESVVHYEFPKTFNTNHI